MHVVEILRQLALGGRAVITTIHQPSSRLYQTLDKLLLLSKARAHLMSCPARPRRPRATLPLAAQQQTVPSLNRMSVWMGFNAHVADQQLWCLLHVHLASLLILQFHMNQLHVTILMLAVPQGHALYYGSAQLADAFFEVLRP